MCLGTKDLRRRNRRRVLIHQRRPLMPMKAKLRRRRQTVRARTLALRLENMKL